jgi:hypothetical protein
MIKFFRKIRQKLLTENKFGKYLIYAIGEIALVMIGILLALQVNNWNQNNNNKKAETYYLNQMKIDLTADSLFLSNTTLNLNKRLPVLENFLRELNKENNKESFNDAIKQYIDIILEPLFFVSNNATYNEMESSAKLGIINDAELRKKIVALYNHLEITKNIFSVNYEFMQPVDAELIYGKGLAKYQKNQKALFTSYLSDEELYKLKEIKFELESNIANWNWTIIDMKPVVEFQLSEIGDVIDQINKHLEKKEQVF